MNKSLVFMFSGQGSQYYHMGAELFREHSTFRKWMLKLNDIAWEVIGESVIDSLYDEKKKKSEIYSRLLYTHPAIFMVEYSIARVLLESGIKPDFVLGSSLGEFTALTVAGVMEPEEMIKVVIKQAQIVESCCFQGGMLSVLYDPRIYYETLVIYENSELVSVNFTSHFVISGKNNNLKMIANFLKEKGITFQFLPVSFGFHSSEIEEAKTPFLNYVKFKVFKRPVIPVISSLYGGLTTEFTSDYLWKVIRQPIEFKKALESLEANKEYVYLDLGPSGTLASFVKYNLNNTSKSNMHHIIDPFDQEIRNLKRFKSEYLIEKEKPKGNEREVMDMLTYVFPGQGSQHKGMGGTLFDEFEELTAQADEILGYSIKELCLENPSQRLSQTQFTQPALFTVNALTYLKKIKETGKKPDYVAGHSLGEYNALFAADAFDFATGLRLVKKRGELMGQAKGGGMAAVLGLKLETVEEILKKNCLTNIGIANINTLSQIVISGQIADIEAAQPIFEAEGVEMYVPLFVSGAFHSSYMENARKEFGKFLDLIEFSSSLTIPVISNVYGRPYNLSMLKKNLIDQITHSVKWTESIRYLMGKGDMKFEEIGPGTVLTGLIRSIRREAESLIIEDDNQIFEEKTVVNVLTESLIREEKQEGLPKVEEAAKIEEIQVAPVFKGNDAETDSKNILAGSLGDAGFRRDYNLKYAYVTGGMYRGIASKEMVVRMGKAGMMGFLGAGGLDMEQIESAIIYIQSELKDGQSYGMNLVHNPGNTQKEDDTIALFLKYGICRIEAAAYMGITTSLIKYRVKGLKRNSDGTIHILNKIMAKVSRPEVAEAFLSPAPQRLVEKLLQENVITQEEAELLKEIPMTDDLTVEADSGGHTDGGVAYALMPAMIKLRDDMAKKYSYSQKIRIGAAGGIGTPEAAAAAFILGADYLLTGSINQCTVEAGTSDVVKDLLQQINVQDTQYAPAGDMFELGAKVQVMKRGVFFPARANKLYELYRQHNSLDEIDEKTKKTIQDRYFGKTFDEVYQEVKRYYSYHGNDRAEGNPKQKMAMVFKWYFNTSSSLAMKGDINRIVDFQVQCGPALGAFNQWVKGTDLENWRNRHSDKIAEKIMTETARLLNERYHSLTST